MSILKKSNKIQLHYYFSDDSHGFDAVIRNECEKELLHIFHDIAKTLEIKLLVQSEPPKEGGFIEFWKFIGDNTNQITIIVSAIAIILSRRPVENKKLTELQIENLELENELKREELKSLHLKSLNESDIDEDLIVRVVNLLSLNYKIIWRRSNFYKKISSYNRISKFSSQRFDDDIPIGKDREISRGNFHDFMLLSNELPESEVRLEKIDLISPVLKSGNFLWKGFLNNEITSFEMQDNTFKSMVQHGEMKLTNKVIINALVTQSRKIDDNGQIKITKTKVKLVVDYSINGITYVTNEGQDYLDNK